MKKRSIKDRFREEKEKIGKLPKGKKGKYIWDYYRYPILFLSFFLIFGIWFIHRSATAVRENWISVAFPNAMTQVGSGTSLWNEYVEYAGYDLDQKNVLFEDKLYFDPTTSGGMNNVYYESFVAMIETGSVDAVTMRKEEIEALGRSGRLIDLSCEACSEIFEKYRDRLVYSLPYDTEYSTDPVPVGIDVSDSILMTRYHIYENSCVFSIGAYSRNIPEAAKFLDWILEGRSGPVEEQILMAETGTEA